MSKFTDYVVFLKGLRVDALRQEAYKLAGWVKSTKDKLEAQDRTIAELKAELAKFQTKDEGKFDWGKSAFEEFTSTPEIKEDPISAKDWLTNCGYVQFADMDMYFAIAKAVKPVKRGYFRGKYVNLYNPQELSVAVTKLLNLRK